MKLIKKLLIKFDIFYDEYVSLYEKWLRIVYRNFVYKFYLYFQIRKLLKIEIKNTNYKYIFFYVNLIVYLIISNKFKNLKLN